jgi:transposase-like protein
VGQVLHGSATTTHAVRAAIQRSKASIQALSERYGINPKTVAKWRTRTSFEDCPMGPKVRHSTVLSADEETLIIEFRRRTLLPLDDCLYALQATIPHLTRSSLHRLLQRHGINRLPTTSGARPRQAFRAYPVGYIHIDLAEVWTEEGKLYLFVAIDRVSKFAFAELHDRATRRVAADFLRRLLEHVPYRIHTVLTDNGFQFTNPMEAGVLERFGRCSRPVSAFGRTPLTSLVPSTVSTIASRNSTIRGPTGKSNG